MYGLTIKHRRFKSDRIIRAINYTIIIAWLISLFLAALYATIATDVVYRDEGARLGAAWDENFKRYAFYLTVILFINCSAGLALNYYRHRRRDDAYHKSLLVFGLISLAGIIFYLFR